MAIFREVDNNVCVINVGDSTLVELCRLNVITGVVKSDLLPSSWTGQITDNLLKLIGWTTETERRQPEFLRVLMAVVDPSGLPLAAFTYTTDAAGLQVVSIAAANKNDTVLLHIPRSTEAGFIIPAPGGGTGGGDGTDTFARSQIVELRAELDGKAPLTAVKTYAAGTGLTSSVSGNTTTFTVSPAVPSLADYATKTYVDTGLAAKAATGHNHDDAYAAKTHSHDTAYAGIDHAHDDTYAVVAHNHDDAYAAKTHNHDTTYLKLDDVVTYAAKPDGGVVVEADESNADQRLLSVDSKVVRVSEAPVTTGEDAGKIPVVQANGSYALADAGSVAGVIQYMAKTDGGLVLSDVSETDPALGREFSLDGSVPRLAVAALAIEKVRPEETQALVLDPDSAEGDSRYEFGLVSVATKPQLDLKADKKEIVQYSAPATGGLVQTDVMDAEDETLLIERKFSLGPTAVRTTNAPDETNDLNKAPLVNSAGGYTLVEVATKTDLDAVVEGLKYRDAVKKTYTGTSVPAKATLTADGLVDDDRFLVNATPAQAVNGVYVVTGDGSARADDFADGDAVSGTYVFDINPTTGGQAYVCTNVSGSDVVGTDSLVFSVYAVGKTYTAAADSGITISGTGVSANFAASGDVPVMAGTAAAGDGTKAARWNHVHPSDTSRLALTGGTMTGLIRYGTGATYANTPADDDALATVAKVKSLAQAAAGNAVTAASVAQESTAYLTAYVASNTVTIGALTGPSGLAAGNDTRFNLTPSTTSGPNVAPPNAIPYVTSAGAWGALAAPQLSPSTEMSLTATRGSTGGVSLAWAGPYAKIDGAAFLGLVSFGGTQPPTTSANIPADSNNTTLVTSSWVNTKLTSSITSVGRGYAGVTAAVSAEADKYLKIDTSTPAAPKVIAQVGAYIGSLADGGDTRFNTDPDGATSAQTTAARGAIAYVGALGGNPTNTTNRWYRLTPPSNLITPFLGFDATLPTGPAPQWRDLSTEISTALPIATTSALGAIKIGTGLTMANGTASVDSTVYATTTSVNAQATKYDKSYTYDLSWSDPAPVPSASGVESYSMIHVAVRAFTIKPALSKGGSVGLPSTNTTFTLQKWASVDALRLNGTPAAFVTVTIDSSGTAAFSSASDISVAAGNVVTLRCPNTTVNSLTNLFLTLACEPA